MKLIGISLRRPTFNEFTAATVMAAGLWVAVVGLARLAQVQIDAVDAGALLLVMVWGCISVRLGIRIDLGRRHLLANVAVSAVLLALYQGAWAFAV